MPSHLPAHNLKKAGLCLAFCSLLVLPALAALAADFEGLWKNATDQVEKGLAVLEQQDKDQLGWLERLTGRDSRYRQIVADLTGILAGSDTSELLNQVYAKRAEIADLRAKIVGWRTDAVSAPASSWNPFTETRDSLSKKIGEAEAQIAALEEEIRLNTGRFHYLVNAQGVELDQEQVASLFAVADGDDLVRIISLAANMRAIFFQMEKLIAEDPNNTGFVKIYAGMYMMLNEAYAHAHELGIAKIEQNYIPELQKILSEARQVRSEAVDLRRQAEGALRDNLEYNIQTNDQTIYVAEQYIAYLRGQLSFLKQSKAAVDRNVVVATNTYNTIRLGTDLISLIRASENDLTGVLSFQMPDFNLLQNPALRNEFTRITDRLQGG